jgi:DNA repair protein RadC
MSLWPLIFAYSLRYQFSSRSRRRVRCGKEVVGSFFPSTAPELIAMHHTPPRTPVASHVTRLMRQRMPHAAPNVKIVINDAAHAACSPPQWKNTLR